LSLLYASSPPVIYTLSLHDALPIFDHGNDLEVGLRDGVALADRLAVLLGQAAPHAELLVHVLLAAGRHDGAGLADGHGEGVAAHAVGAALVVGVEEQLGVGLGAGPVRVPGRVDGPLEHVVAGHFFSFPKITSKIERRSPSSPPLRSAESRAAAFLARRSSALTCSGVRPLRSARMLSSSSERRSRLPSRGGVTPPPPRRSRRTCAP